MTPAPLPPRRTAAFAPRCATWLSLALIVPPAPVLADAPQAHVHGVATLSFVADGDALIAELASPLVNLLGFEHTPRTEAQRAAHAAMLDDLSDPATLFDLARGECRLLDTTVAADDHGHADDRAHDDGHRHAGDAHADLRVEYAFSCAAPANLRRIPVTAFAMFPGIDRIDALFVGDKIHAATLAAGSPVLELR